MIRCKMICLFSSFRSDHCGSLAAGSSGGECAHSVLKWKRKEEQVVNKI